MNRTIALFLALVILLAHTLALHKNPAGEIAAPYDAVYVPIRMARHYVQGGSFAWNLSQEAAESYGSPAWVLIAAIPERLWRLGIQGPAFSQLVGTLAALATAVVLARFSRVRLAGVVAPVLFVVSGAVAAAAASGTEATLLAFALTLAFLAFERRRSGMLAVALVLAVLIRDEGVLFAALLFAFEMARARERARAGPETEPSLRLAFVPALAAALAVMLARLTWTGHVLSPWAHSLLALQGAQLREGLQYVRDFFVTTGGPLLFALPLVFLARGTLTGVGRRACALTLFWTVLVVLSGGDDLPFHQRMVPILAILFVAVQEAMTRALDSRRRGLPQVAWALFLLGVCLSALASKYPGDLGPLRLEKLHRRWMSAHTRPPFGYGKEHSLGRIALDQEIRVGEKLRAIGAFMRGQLDPAHAVLSPWPGLLGYISRLEVIDALGRATPLPGESQPRAWVGNARVDVVRLLQEGPEYVVPTLGFESQAPSINEIAEMWSLGLDIQPGVLARGLAIREQLEQYELITVPSEPAAGRLARRGPGRFYLLRRKGAEIDLSPALKVTVNGRDFRVEVQHGSHEQLVDLRVQVQDREGRLWTMRPTGEFSVDGEVVARSSILLFPTGTRSIELLRGRVPDGMEPVQIRAVLRNPGARGEFLFTTACAEVAVTLH
jgi:hypothetical protein